jgi:hypothetical protein
MSDSQSPRLDDTLGPAEWSILKPHSNRNAVFLVLPPLDLLSVGQALEKDDTEKVSAWLKSSLLVRPSSDQIATWNATPSKTFQTLVVAPYVLIQEILS